MRGSEVLPMRVRRPWPVGNGNDLQWLGDVSPSLRASAAMRARPRNRGRSYGEAGGQSFEDQCSDIRLSLRVTADHWECHPVYEPDVIRYMRYPAFCRSRDYRELQWYQDRRGTDLRVLKTVDRAIRDAAKLGIPLWPSLLLVDHGERVRAFVTGESDDLPRDAIHGTGLSVQLGHGVLRHLPWSCWEWIDRLVGRSGTFTGYPLLLVHPVPGEYELAADCRDLDRSDYSLRPRRLGAEDARTEADALLRFYAGGPWEPPAEVDHG